MVDELLHLKSACRLNHTTSLRSRHRFMAVVGLMRIFRSEFAVFIIVKAYTEADRRSGVACYALDVTLRA